MAQRVPGMGPVQDPTRSPYKRMASRGQTPDASAFRPAPLQPVARPVDTYTRPEAPTDSPLLQLADTLAAINPSIRNFAKTIQEPQDSVAAIQRAKVEMTPEQFSQAVKDGTLPGMKTAAGYELTGKDRGVDFLTKLQADAVQFDPSQQDWNSFVRERAATYMKENGIDGITDRMFVDNFWNTVYQGLGPMEERVRLSAAQTQTAELEAAQMNVWMHTITQLDDKGATGLEKAQAIFSDFDANAQFRGMPYTKQIDMTMTIAERAILMGDTETARALLQTERQNGAYKGSIANDPRYADKASAILAQADKVDAEMVEGQRIAEAENALKSNLAVQGAKGQLPFLTDVTLPAKNGGTKTYSVEEQKKMWAEDNLRRSQETAIRLKETPEQTRTRELVEFANNGIKHPQWEQVLKAGYPAGGFSSVNDAKAIPPSLSQGWETYRWIKAQNPQYLGTILDEQTNRYYRAIEIGVSRGKTLDQAYLDAAYVTNDPEGRFARSAAARSRDIEKAVASNYYFDPANLGELQSTVIELADHHMKLGLTAEEATKAAIEDIDRDYTKINGSYVRTAGLPAEFPGVVQEIIQSYVEKNPDEGLSAEDITIREQRPGVWIMVQSSGVRNPLLNPTDRVITLGSIQKWMDQKQTNAATGLSNTINNR